MNSLPKGDIRGHLERFGVPTITELRVVQEEKVALVPVNKEVTWIQAFLSYETPEGRGKGFIRLRESSPGKGDWLAYTFFVRCTFSVFLIIYISRSLRTFFYHSSRLRCGKSKATKRMLSQDVPLEPPMENVVSLLTGWSDVKLRSTSKTKIPLF